jgi:hypothetical protein
MDEARGRRGRVGVEGRWVWRRIGRGAAHPRHNGTVGASTPLFPPRRCSRAAELIVKDGGGQAATRIIIDECVDAQAVRID